jgi:crotonobetainyl-CoA:carnitine CoA-transferase CaiB-like acyl-CoA transferase
MGDTLSAIHAALGIALAIIQRAKPGGEGQVIDVALYESIFNLMEGIVPEYDGGGAIRGPSGTTVTGIVPTNTYMCDDGKHVVIGGNGDSIFKRLMTVAGRSDMAENPEMADNAGRVKHEAEIDMALADWCAAHSSTHVIYVLEEARVPVGPIYSVEDMVNDEHYNARGMFETVEINGEPLKIPSILPKLSGTPGRTDFPGGEVGSHNDEVLGEILGLDASQVEALRADGVVA